MLFILFAEKPNSGLRFYINYRKLNIFIERNYYLILFNTKILLIYIGKYISENIYRKIYIGKYISENIYRKIYIGKYKYFTKLGTTIIFNKL